MPTQPHRITGPELLTLFREMTQAGTTKGDMVRAAGYIGTRSDGGERLHFTDFYEAILAARGEEADPTGAHTSSRAILAGWQTLSGEPFGPWLPIVPREGGSASFCEESLNTVREWAKAHAEEILQDRGSAFLMICDDVGTEPLLVAYRHGWESMATGATAYAYDVQPVSQLPANVEVCDDCGALTTTQDGTRISGGRYVCSSCADDLESCNECGASTHTDDLTEAANGRSVCPDCLSSRYMLCPVNGEHYRTGDMVYIYGGGWYANGRRHDYISRDAAEDLRHDGRLWHDEDGDFTVNEPEPEDNDHDGMPMFAYGTCPNDELSHDMPNTKHRHGAELEYKGSHPDWDELEHAMAGRAILTEDGSVTGEVVTVCLTMGELRKHLANIAESLKYTHNDRSTGLHVHTDREALTPWQWFRLTQYTKEHADTLSGVAGRDNREYGSFRCTSADDWERFVDVWHNCNGDRKDGWSFRRETVELRVCRATRTGWRALARLSFLQRLLAIGRLPDSAKPSGPELMGWLAQDPRIQRLTGWEPGTFNYRDALQLPAQADDLSPAHRATRAEVWMAEVRYQAATQVCRNLQRSLPYHWEEHSLGDRITRSLLNEEERRHLQATRDRLALTTL